MPARGALGTVALAVLVVLAALAALGVPDFGLAGQFLTGSYPSTDASLALVSVICWILVIVFVVAVLATAIRSATERQLVIRRWTRAVMFCAMGAIVLGVGVYRHNAVGYAMSCDDCQQRITEATHLAGQ